MLTACEKDIPYDSGDFKQKLVVNGFNSSDTTMSVLLTKSSPLLADASASRINQDVKVLVLKDGFLLLSDSLSIANGVLSLPFKGLLGSTYELQVNCPGVPSIRAVDSVPQRIPDFEIDTIRTSDNKHRLAISIDDLPGNDRYLLKLRYSGKEWDGTDSVQIDYPVTFTSTDKSFVSSIRTVANSASLALFSDDTWVGISKEIELILPEELIDYPNFRPDNVQVELNIVSPTMYQYYIDLQYNTNVYGGPLASASSVEGNVDQGLGAFCFYTRKVVTKRLN